MPGATTAMMSPGRSNNRRDAAIAVVEEMEVPVVRGSRLDSAAWIDAALQLLAREGIDRVRIDILAKQLGVTKGSFYWHFKDRDALHVAMLADWRRRATVWIIDRLETGQDHAAARLSRLIRMPLGPKSIQGAGVELSLRLWSRRDPRARAALEEIDALRLRHTARLLREIGLAPDAAEARALIVYSFQRVVASLIVGQDDALIDRCIAELIAL